MTTSLKKAFKKAESLPKAAQQQLADQLLGDIEGELRWDQTLQRSQPLLERMATRALQQRKRGKTHTEYDKLLKRF